MPETYQITLKIKRFDPDNQRSWMQEYQLEAGRIQRFVDLLRKINDEQDPTLTWNSSCEHGQCGTCSLKINGKPLLACELLVEDAIRHFKTSIFRVAPLEIAPVIRDLVIDVEKAYQRLEEVKPYLIQPKATETEIHAIKPEVLEYYVNATRCINCFCCASACISSHHSFLGPNAMLSTIIRIMDPRESATEERLSLLYSDRGIYRCHTSRACSHVCPKQIDVAHFMTQAKAGRFTPK